MSDFDPSEFDDMLSQYSGMDSGIKSIAPSTIGPAGSGGGGISVVPMRPVQEHYELALDLATGKSFSFLPSQGCRDLCVPVKNWNPKPKCLGDADYVFIDPMVIYGFEVLEKAVSIHPDVKLSLITDLTKTLTEARKSFTELCEEEKKIPANSIFKKWMEMKGVIGEQSVFTTEQHNRGEALMNLDPSELGNKDDATFLKLFYEWWHEVDSFKAGGSVLIEIMKEVAKRQALFAHATSELSPCFVYMQHHAKEREGNHDKHIAFLRQCESMGFEFSPLAREFLFTVPGIEENATPLCCVDPTFCVWDRDWSPKVKVSRASMEQKCSLKQRHLKAAPSDLVAVSQTFADIAAMVCEDGN